MKGGAVNGSPIRVGKIYAIAGRSGTREYELRNHIVATRVLSDA